MEDASCCVLVCKLYLLSKLQGARDLRSSRYAIEKQLYSNGVYGPGIPPFLVYGAMLLAIHVWVSSALVIGFADYANSCFRSI